MPTAPICPAENTASAIVQGNVAQVRYLLELGHHPNERLPDARTPLILCAFIPDVKWARSLANTLLEKGGLVGLKDRNGLNALHYACIYKRPHLVTVYLKAIDYDLNQVDKFGNTALHYAARSGNMEIVKLVTDKLIRYSFSVDVSNKNGITPLMMAWSVPNIDIALFLQTECSADTNRRDLHGMNARHHEAEGRLRLRNQQRKEHERQMVSLIRFDDMSYAPRRQALIEERRRESMRYRSWLEIEREKKAVPEILPSEDSLLPPAEPGDARNDPHYLFKTSPVEFFQRGLMDTAAAVLSTARSNQGRVAIKSCASQRATRPATAATLASSQGRQSRQRPRSAFSLRRNTRDKRTSGKEDSGDNDAEPDRSKSRMGLHPSDEVTPNVSPTPKPETRAQTASPDPSNIPQAMPNQLPASTTLVQPMSSNTLSPHTRIPTIAPVTTATDLSPSLPMQPIETGGSWKTQMGVLFNQYTYQCSPSYRPSAKPIEEPPRASLGPTEKEIHSLDDQSVRGNRRGSQMSTRGSSFKDSKKGRRDRKISSSPHADDLSSAAGSSSGPTASRASKKAGKVNRSMSRVGMASNSSTTS